MAVGAQRSIDWAVLTEAGLVDQARAILGKDRPWARLFDIADLPTGRLITVEFLLTFRYRAYQAAVAEQEDEELQPDIEFSICNQHMEMSIERFAELLGIYYEPETITEAFIQGLTQGEDGVMREWWPQISSTEFHNHRGVDTEHAPSYRLSGCWLALQGVDLPGGAHPVTATAGAAAAGPPQHPPLVYRAVRLTEPLEALLYRMAAQTDELVQNSRRWDIHVERRLDRLKDLVQWMIDAVSERA
ncbi:hypothetical protein R6Q57_010953 [Mikania cordata]